MSKQNERIIALNIRIIAGRYQKKRYRPVLLWYNAVISCEILQRYVSYPGVTQTGRIAVVSFYEDA